MLSRSRFLLSLVVILSLSALALADCAPVNADLLHSSAGFSRGSSVYSGVSSGPASEKWDSHTSVVSSGNTGNQGFVQLHGTVSRKNGNWSTWHAGTPGSKNTPTPLATPEPGSLMLLSTGLMGIAGVLRRKLHLV